MSGMNTVADDIAAIGRIPAVPTILEAMAGLTGLRFTAVARVTDTTWTACAVRDEIAFGLLPGGELELVTTICNEIRQHGQPVIFGSASTDPRFKSHPTPKLYGFESYISIPIFRGDGAFFGTLCAIDPRPAELDSPHLANTLALFAQLIATHLDAFDLYNRRADALAAASDEALRVGEENRRVAALMVERDRAAEAMGRELRDTRRLRDVASRLIGADGSAALFGEILDAAIEITGADAGTIQLHDSATDTLSFLTTRGFDPDIVAHFGRVDASSGSPCGIALATGQRAFVRFDADAPDLDGSTRWHLDAGMRVAQWTPLLSRTGKPLGMFSTHWRESRDLAERELRFLDLLGRQAADLIERTQAQDAVRESERELREGARRKDEFLAVLAHELRNPLAPIRSGVDLLQHASHEPLVAKVRPMMERQVNHMVRLVDDLLDVSRISSGKVELKHETVSLWSLVDTAVEANRGAIAAAGLQLQMEVDDPDRRLNVDPTRMSQVLSNVLHNATKFTPAGGTITLSTALSGRDGQADARQVFRIKDTGLGIPENRLPTIFELFTQVRPDSSMRHGGMGIGLALARSLVEMHGGSIAAESAGAGQGSTFVIDIPVSTGVSRDARAPVPGALDRLAEVRALVVDDNEDAAEALGLLLSQSGGDVRVAYRAEKALELLDEFDPTLVLLDIGMPHIDGYEACRLIRERKGSGIQIVALTGWGQEEDRRRAAEAGFDAHLTKPVDFDRLLEIALQGRTRRLA